MQLLISSCTSSSESFSECFLQADFRPPREFVYVGLDYLCSWPGARHIEVDGSSGRDSSESQSRWKRPLANMLKCNTDAALLKDKNVMGFAMILRDA
ncbi:hypothetical protein PTKIN_Ptkin17bG0120900 [Pterospermum kingtungense]